MITEDYVNKEIALLLREKGFDEPTLYHYNGDNKEPTHTINYDLLKNSELKEFCFAAPTIQMAIKWLREVHNIFIEIGTRIDLNGKYHFSYTILDKECKYIRRGYTSFDWNYKQACEAAIKYVLENLI